MSFRPIGSAALLYSKYSASRWTSSKVAVVDIASPPALSVARSVRTANERANEALTKTRIRGLLLSCDIGDVPATEPVDTPHGRAAHPTRSKPGGLVDACAVRRHGLVVALGKHR